MLIERVIDIAAPPEKVWEVMSDVSKWQEWTDSIRYIDSLDGRGPLAVGKRYKIFQPKLPPAVWTLTALEPGRYFEWQSKGPGIKVTAGHRVDPAPGGSRATLYIRQEGLLGDLMGRLLENKVSRPYVEKEAQGLKRRSEASA
jgi:hypothetical protein